MVDQCREIADNNGPKLANFEHLDPENLDVSNPDAVCPFLGEEAWVNWEGRFDPCCAPDEERKGLGSFGIVGEAGLMAIWESDKYRELLENYVENELCQKCPMRRLPED